MKPATGPDAPAPGESTVDALDVHAFEVPTDGPDGREQDGTLEWHATTLVLVRVHAGGRTGLGYTYGDVSVASFVQSVLAPVITGRPVAAPPALWERMGVRMRNAGRPGVGAMALSAVDVALWDLKARLLGLPLVRLLPAHHDRVPVYGSGGFTNYPLDRLTDQLTGWVEQGIERVKLKTSREPEEDPRRLTAVRRAVGDEPDVFTDANGALGRKAALYWAHRFHEEWDVRWFEEPVASADLEGLRMLRERGPARLEITAGSTPSPPRTSSTSSTDPPSTASRPTSPGAAASPAYWRSPDWRPRTTSTCPRTAPPRCPPTPSVSYGGCGTWSTSTTTCASRTCSSTAPCPPRAAPCAPTPGGPDSAWRSSGPTRSRTACTERARPDPGRGLRPGPGAGTRPAREPGLRGRCPAARACARCARRSRRVSAASGGRSGSRAGRGRAWAAPWPGPG